VLEGDVLGAGRGEGRVRGEGRTAARSTDGRRQDRTSETLHAARRQQPPSLVRMQYIQLYSPECTLAENIYIYIYINNNKQNKDRNILINTVQLNARYTFVNVLTKDITEDALGKFPHEFRTPFQ